MQSNQCLECTHYMGEIQCDAFPDGIPEAIITGDYDHAEPYPGDNGIQFEPMEPTGATNDQRRA